MLDFIFNLEKNPIIAAVKSKEELTESLKSPATMIFILFGSIIDIASTVCAIQQAGKLAILHIDLIEGLSQKDIAVEFIKEHTHVDGIISTRPNIIKRAKELGLFAIQRFFILDSMALSNAKKQIAQSPADAIEVLPGVMPKIIGEIAVGSKKPIIAGGLICDKDDVISAISAGAAGVSSTNKYVWFL